MNQYFKQAQVIGSWDASYEVISKIDEANPQEDNLMVMDFY